MQPLMLLYFTGVFLVSNPESVTTENITDISFSKIYLVTDEDYEKLSDLVGVPDDYVQLSLCEVNSETTIGQIEEGTSAAFTDGVILPWCYMVPDGNPHCHQFIRVRANCNTNVSADIKLYSQQIIAMCPYKLQQKNPPHKMGKSSWAIIFQNDLKNSQ